MDEQQKFHIQKEVQLSQTLDVIENFAKLLKVMRNDIVH